ncbi:unnamed protein product [Caenorhabditis angaria]|uniref:Phosphate transporter n=1 Tax=Caenorhabditis angaria TaxID=860376 RepID=A0A9P1MX14_9PELO|nr:unnamed protein product [Caenorhabditis angaria]
MNNNIQQLFDVSTSTISTFFIKPYPYYDLEAVQWALIFGVSFLLGVGMGANDVADAFGTSVGTGVVTLTQAFILATIVEMMGSLASGFMGSGKSLQIIDAQMFADNPNELVLGNLAMLIGCAVWLMIATFYSMPVSTVHSLLGATLGFALVLRGFEGIIWDRFLIVLALWILAPIASAFFTLLVFFIIDALILQDRNPVQTGLFYLPVIYFIVIFTNVMLFMQDGSRPLHMNDIPFWYDVAVSIGLGAIAGFIALFIVGPIMKKRLEKKPMELPRIASSLSYSFPIEPRGWLRKAMYWAFPPIRNDDQKAVRLFSFLQLITACFAGFAHGANDVSNCVEPIRELVHLYNQSYNDANTELNITIYVGLLSTLAVLFGIWILGIRVIRTVGENFSKMNPATGFAVEFGTAIIALATNIYNIPQSITHCLVGSIFGLGLVRSGPILKWKTVRYVFLSWILTIPVSGMISASVMYIFQVFVVV